MRVETFSLDVVAFAAALKIPAMCEKRRQLHGQAVPKDLLFRCSWIPTGSQKGCKRKKCCMTPPTYQIEGMKFDDEKMKGEYQSFLFIAE